MSLESLARGAFGPCCLERLERIVQLHLTVVNPSGKRENKKTKFSQQTMP
jgi:hypothetical protein